MSWAIGHLDDVNRRMRQASAAAAILRCELDVQRAVADALRVTSAPSLDGIALLVTGEYPGMDVELMIRVEFFSATCRILGADCARPDRRGR